MRPLDVIDRVPESPAMGLWNSILLLTQNLQVKSLILAQIERWRRA
jgi:hypothetical protein